MTHAEATRDQRPTIHATDCTGRLELTAEGRPTGRRGSRPPDLFRCDRCGVLLAIENDPEGTGHRVAWVDLSEADLDTLDPGTLVI